MFAALPDEDAARIAVWVVVPPPEVKAAAAEVQREFAHLDWLAPVPEHFLHVTIGRADGAPPNAWDDIEPFQIDYEHVNCFHEAVIGEVHGDGPRQLATALRPGLETFLPHLTLAYVREPAPPEELRAALLPVRDRSLGGQLVEEVALVEVPFAQTTLLQPWTVATRVRVGSPSEPR
jgi:2'-5' RNA ligase